MGYKNLTVRGKKDGFGCQLNAKLSGLAFCYNHPKYRYIHTPFASVSHGWREEPETLNEFMGIPDNRHGKKIHAVYRYMNQVFSDPNHFYNYKTLGHIRQYYWDTPKPNRSEDEIVVHIRRGDVQINRGGDRRRRHTPNPWYNITIPKLAQLYPNYTIAIHSEGDMDEFQSIMDNWNQDLIERVSWKLSEPYIYDQKFDLPTAFHDMVTAKVLLQSKSGLSYTAGLYCEGDVFSMPSRAKGQGIGLNHWKSAERDLEPKWF
jgi:hypothetical protein